MNGPTLAQFRAAAVATGSGISITGCSTIPGDTDDTGATSLIEGNSSHLLVKLFTSPWVARTYCVALVPC